MTSLIGLSAQALADELRRRGIISIKVDEPTESDPGEIVLSPTLSIGVPVREIPACRTVRRPVSRCCYLMRRTVPYVNLGYQVIADGIIDVETLQAAITKAKWKRAKS